MFHFTKDSFRKDDINFLVLCNTWLPNGESRSTNYIPFKDE